MWSKPNRTVGVGAALTVATTTAAIFGVIPVTDPLRDHEAGGGGEDEAVMPRGGGGLDQRQGGVEIGAARGLGVFHAEGHAGPRGQVEDALAAGAGGGGVLRRARTG